MSTPQPQSETQNNTVESSGEFTKQNILALGNKVRLSDSEEESALEMYCYNQCGMNDTDFLKSCRGVIFHGDKLAFKAYPYTDEYSDKDCDQLKDILTDDYSKYQFYDAHEGCLIRVFYFNDKWYVTTHRKLDAFRSKWGSKESFGEIFKTAILHEYKKEDSKLHAKLGQVEDETVYETFLNSLNKEFSYMFLIRNTFENRIVCAASATYTVYNAGTYNSNHDFIMENDSCIPYPTKHTFSTFDQLREHVNKAGFESTAGIIIFGENNKQWKLLNHEYVTLFEARGNEPSIKFRYLQVRMDKDKTNALYFLYPRYADTFDDYENTIYDVARSINNNYIRRFIKKKYVTVPTEEYVVMKACHTWHLEDRGKNRISLRKVFELLNQQSPTNLNKMIRRFNAEKKTETEEEVKKRRPRAKSDLDETPEASSPKSSEGKESTSESVDTKITETQQPAQAVVASP